MATTKPMTADELEQMPEDGYRYDLIRVELKRMSPIGFRHLKVAGTVIWVLSDDVKPRGLGVVGGEGSVVIELDPDTVLAPDVALVRADRLLAGRDELDGGEALPGFRVRVALLFA